MLANYLRISLRNIRQNPVYAFINVFSLTIGLAACIVIWVFISDEKSFDSWHSKGSTIYRLNQVQNFTGTKRQLVALSGSPFGPVLKEEFQEIQSYSRFWGGARRALQLGEKQILVDQVVTVDSTFLNIFDFELLFGDKETALDEPNAMVLTEETARKFFDNVEEAIGQTITKRNREYKVTGIAKNVPENSHLQFDALESFETYVRLDSGLNSNWNGNYLVTYLLLAPNTDFKKLEVKFPDWFIRWTGQADVNEKTSLWLQPFNDVHLGSAEIEHDYQNYRKFNGKYLGIFTITGIFILLIASVNFMNLTTARASRRWKEIGVRTSVGAKKRQLFGQFILESLLMAVSGLAIALVLDFLLLPLLSQLIGRQLILQSLLAVPSNWAVVLSLAALLGLLTGIYPSLYMTSANAGTVLKGGSGVKKSSFQNSLVVLQFGLAVGMMVSTAVVLQQLWFMQNRDIGFVTDKMLLVQLDRVAGSKYRTLKTEISRNPNILGVTASGQRLGNNFHQWGLKVRTDTGVFVMAPSNVNVDPDYLTVYGMRIKEGRNFDNGNPSNNNRSFIFNEALVKQLQLEDPLGVQVGHSWFHDDSLGTVIGVVEDFNFNSLHHSVNTLSIVSHINWEFDEMTIRLDGTRVEETIAEIKAVWDQQVTTFPFTYTFLDQHLTNLYRTERQMSSVVSIMAVLAILISCMGLFGLALITSERRVKEIGIRKALGATEIQITTLISSQFTRLIGLGFVIVSPVAYYVLSNWLDTFAYRVSINPGVFLGCGFLSLVIGLCTIGYHTIRSARANPVKALRYE